MKKDRKRSNLRTIYRVKFIDDVRVGNSDNN